MTTVSPSAPTRHTQRQGPSTLPDEVPIQRLRRARLIRRLFLTLLAAFVLCGMLGLFGVRRATSTAANGEWTIKAAYPSVTRAGLAVPMEFEVTKQGGFDDTVVMRMTSDYFDLYDQNGFDPQPSRQWSDDEFIYWEFDAPPDGEAMTISVDTRTGSSVQLTKKTAEVSVLVDGSPVVTADLKTWVMF